MIMLTKDAIEKGKLIATQLLHDAYLKRLSDYNNNPTICNNCKNPLPYNKRTYKYCSRSCAVTINNKFTKSTQKIPKLSPIKPKKTKIISYCINCNDILTPKNYTGYCYKCYRKILAIKDFKIKMQNTSYVPQPSKIRNYILFTRQYKCQSCNRTRWLNLPISLEVHHIDGNHKNNQENNLQLLCPNCHSLTNTYRNKNPSGFGRERRKKYIKNHI